MLLLFGSIDGVAADNDTAHAGYFDTIWPTGRSDAWRSGAGTGAGLPKDITSNSLVARRAKLPNTPLLGVTYTEDAIYVLGGQSFLLDYFSFVTAADSDTLTPSVILESAVKSAFVRPYIAKIDSKTMTVIDILELPQDGDLNLQLPTLNYYGNLLVHENGMIYVVSTSKLFEVDPDTMEITGTLDLPRYETRSLATTYNSLALAPLTGDIILKGFNFFDATQPAKLVAVDPTNLTIRFQGEQSGMQATRLTVVVQDDKQQYAYATTSTETIRYIITESAFEVDDTWSETYRTPGDGTTDAVNAIYMGEDNYVILQNNNTVIVFVREPMKIFTQDTDTTAPTLVGTNSNSSSLPGGNWFSVATDPFNTKIFASNDSINGILAAWRREQGQLVKKWETDRYQSTAGAVIGSDQEHLYIDDRRCNPSGRHCKLFVVVLDLTTGAQIAEVKVAGSAPTLGGMFLNEDSVFFIASEADRRNGYVTRVSSQRHRNEMNDKK